MRFVEIETIHGHKHHVNVGQVDYIKPHGKEECTLVFGAGASGLHTLRVKGSSGEVADRLESQTRRWLLGPISGAMSAPPLSDEDRSRLYDTAAHVDDQDEDRDEAGDRAAGTMERAHEQMRELLDTEHERTAGGGEPGPVEPETKPAPVAGGEGQQKPPETEPAALTRGAPKKKD